MGLENHGAFDLPRTVSVSIPGSSLKNCQVEGGAWYEFDESRNVRDVTENGLPFAISKEGSAKSYFYDRKYRLHQRISVTTHLPLFSSEFVANF